jgi:hypothetical protein
VEREHVVVGQVRGGVTVPPVRSRERAEGVGGARRDEDVDVAEVLGAEEWAGPGLSIWLCRYGA